MKNITFPIMLMAVILLTGCATKVKQDAAVNELSKAMRDIASSFEQLSKIEAANNSGYSVRNYNYDESKIPSHWLQEVELVSDYNGTVENFLKMMSLLAGLNEPRIDVAPRATVVPISINKGRRKVISFLADAGYQSGNAATVNLKFADNLIVLTFNNGI